MRGDRGKRPRPSSLRDRDLTARADLWRGLRGLLPGRLRGGALRGRLGTRVPGLRGRMRRRVDPALRRRQSGPEGGRADPAPGPGPGARRPGWGWLERLLGTDVVDVPPLLGRLGLGPTVVRPDLVDHGAHRGVGEVERIA